MSHNRKSSARTALFTATILLALAALPFAQQARRARILQSTAPELRLQGFEKHQAMQAESRERSTSTAMGRALRTLVRVRRWCRTSCTLPTVSLPPIPFLGAPTMPFPRPTGTWLHRMCPDDFDWAKPFLHPVWEPGEDSGELPSPHAVWMKPGLAGRGWRPYYPSCLALADRGTCKPDGGPSCIALLGSRFPDLSSRSWP